RDVMHFRFRSPLPSHLPHRQTQVAFYWHFFALLFRLEAFGTACLPMTLVIFSPTRSTAFLRLSKVLVM
ncbi:MAG: hypothetical protein ACI9TH_004486, partial [Kiritimatiellia bacterium]